jgi:chromosome partitioning protein
VLSELRSKFRDYLMESTVNFNTKLKEAASFGQPITEYDPGSRGYKDFVNLARELMGHRPVDIEPATNEKLSRPAELVQRAKQLAQLTNFQFGRNSVQHPAAQAAVAIPEQPAQQQHLAPIGSNGNGSGNNGHVSRIAQYSDADAQPTPAPATPPARFNADAPKTTAQKLEEFYGVKQIGDEVLFAAKFVDAKKVLIAGDFNGWQPISTPMVLESSGQWRMKLPLPPGRYRYRFVVDGKWMTDPNNKYVETNQFGELNNVVDVD